MSLARDLLLTGQSDKMEIRKDGTYPLILKEAKDQTRKQGEER
jgi:hypothetical protein